ncbi:hypothetical protein AVEN_102992-1 [Araneus ventricosus]|uniref:Uncharacterized protein n=1 Tax=Araneus ventricosus TaxID=182803 RepID=A0A4Y2B7Z1_ARAVE|nr:hypothetical protein AVEN_102992-1 [Araneus ventricosus]
MRKSVISSLWINKASWLGFRVEEAMQYVKVPQVLPCSTSKYLKFYKVVCQSTSSFAMQYVKVPQVLQSSMSKYLKFCHVVRQSTSSFAM